MNRRVGQTGSDFLGGILAAITIFFVGGGVLLFVLANLSETFLTVLLLAALGVFAYQKFTPRG